MTCRMFFILAGFLAISPGFAQSEVNGSVRISAIVNGSVRAENSTNLIGSIFNSRLTGSTTIHTVVHSAVSSQGDGGVLSIGSVYNVRGASGVSINVSVAGIHHQGSGKVFIGGIHAE